VVRICKLGVLPNVEELVARFPVSESGAAAISEHSRRRGRLALDVDDGDDGRTEYFAMAPDRFHGLPEQFFWEETFTIPVRKTWAEQHADEVYERRQVPGMTYKKLISEFGKSRHILSAAVRIASKRREA
jgi:hypothetical protein